MKSYSLVVVWFTVLLLVLLGLYFSWQSAFTLSERKASLISKWVTDAKPLQSQNLRQAEFNVVIIGTSLTQAGFDTGQAINNQNVAVSKVTVGAAAATELEAVLIHVLRQQPDLILIEINPWTLSFGAGHHFSLHRLWMASIVQQGWGGVPQRYHQSGPSSRSDVYRLPNSTSMQKFVGFQPIYRPFSALTIQALINRNTQIAVKFFYPGMALEVASTKSKAWHEALDKMHQKISLQTGVDLVPAIDNLNYQNYTDLVHVNRQGAKAYMAWLEAVINEYRDDD
ncbi:hypothetical protein [Shewanella waksmanii]|uniref:hypothetical protein n=1 Tax=Shewanella waksmanii TaxID=213783 RepID=UPI0037362C25